MKKYSLLFLLLLLFLIPNLGWSTVTQTNHKVKPKVVNKTKQIPTKVLKEYIPYTIEQQAAITYEVAIKALHKGDQATANINLQKVLELWPAHTNARSQLINYYHTIKDVDKEEQLLQQGLVINSKEPMYIKQMALLLNNKAEYSKALTLLLTMPAKHTYDLEYKQLLALTYYYEGFFDLAQKHYSQLLRMEPNNGKWRLGLAVAQDVAGDWQQALENFARARHYGNLDSETIKYVQQRIDNLQQSSSKSRRGR